MALIPLDVLTAHGIDSDLAITIYEELSEKFDWKSVHDRTPENVVDITIHTTGNPMLWYFGTDQRAYHLDEPTSFPTLEEMSQRELQIALALTDLSAHDLHQRKI